MKRDFMSLVKIFEILASVYPGTLQILLVCTMLLWFEMC